MTLPSFPRPGKWPCQGPRYQRLAVRAVDVAMADGEAALELCADSAAARGEIGDPVAPDQVKNSRPSVS
jgi:hypothetical protein